MPARVVSVQPVGTRGPFHEDARGVGDRACSMTNPSHTRTVVVPMVVHVVNAIWIAGVSDQGFGVETDHLIDKHCACVACWQANRVLCLDGDDTHRAAASAEVRLRRRVHTNGKTSDVSTVVQIWVAVLELP